MDDPRFSKFQTDPKFRTVPRKERKVKIDDRFSAVLKDKKFVSKVNVDKRGRPGNFSTKENYQKFYELDSSDSESSDEEDDDKEKDDNTAPKASKNKKSKSKSSGAKIDSKVPVANVDYARGEVFMSDSSSEEEDSSDQDDKEEIEESEGFDKWGELDHDAEFTEEATKRLAICNMDWDRVRAEDLFLALSSFCPPGGRLLKVSIYPSEFGKKRIAEEEALGPEELRGSKNNVVVDESSDDQDEEEIGYENNEDEDKKATEKVRKYQVNRLKYYYGVAEFNSPIAANKVYIDCDQSEYELSATKFDLRFIPEDMEFNDDPPTETCNHAPDAEKYKPKLFSTSALSLGKVDLTWDETDPERIEAMKKSFDGDEEALKAYIADSSSEEEEKVKENKKEKNNKKKLVKTSDEKIKENLVKMSQDELIGEMSADDDDDEADIAKYRALLNIGTGNNELEENTNNENSDDNDDDGTGMEMTFAPNADQKIEEISVENMTPWEKYLHKKKNKRKEKRMRQQNQNQASSSKEVLTENQNSDSDDEEIPSDVDLNDPFFKQESTRQFDGRKKQKNTNLSSNLVPLGTKSSKKSSEAAKKNMEGNADKNNDLALLVMDSDDDKSHFDYKDIVKNESRSKKAQKKAAKKLAKLAKSKGQDRENANEFKLDLQDTRFSAIFQNPKYNVDPSNPSFKKTKSMQEVIQEKQKRILQGDKIKKSSTETEVVSKNPEEEPFKKRAKLSGLDSLVHSVQAKSKRMKATTSTSSRKNMKSKS